VVSFVVWFGFGFWFVVESDVSSEQLKDTLHASAQPSHIQSGTSQHRAHKKTAAAPSARTAHERLRVCHQVCHGCARQRQREMEGGGAAIVLNI